MSDSYREVTSRSWLGRIGSSVGGMLIGLLLVVGMIALLFWNEGRAVQTAKSLAEGSGLVVSVPADTVDPANDGKLVHVGGKVTTDAVPSDDQFGVSAPGIRLVRSSEIYQWIEESKSETQTKLGGGQETVTTYSYAKEWRDRPADSSDFKKPDGHGNPPMEIRNTSFQVPGAKLAAFDLDKPVLDLIGGEQPLRLKADQRQAVDAAYSGPAKLGIVDGAVYLGRDPAVPTVGDYRIRYQSVPAGDVSIVGRQNGARFEPYRTEAGDELLMVDTGLVPADKMFAEAATANSVLTWILRAVGLFLLFVAFSLIASPLGAIADVIPFLGSVVRLGTGILAFVSAVLVGSIVIAVAWFWYRPLLSLAIFGGGVLVLLAASYVAKARAGTRTAIPAAPPAPRP